MKDEDLKIQGIYKDTGGNESTEPSIYMSFVHVMSASIVYLPVSG